MGFRSAKGYVEAMPKKFRAADRSERHVRQIKRFPNVPKCVPYYAIEKIWYELVGGARTKDMDRLGIVLGCWCGALRL